MHAKYEVCISYGSKVIAKVKVDNRQTNRQTNKQTGQKQYAPDHSIRGHKKLYGSMYMSNDTPVGLQNKVQFDIRLYFYRRGNENMRKMTKVLKTDEKSGLKYVVQAKGELTKNHWLTRRSRK